MLHDAVRCALSGPDAGNLSEKKIELEMARAHMTARPGPFRE